MDQLHHELYHAHIVADADSFIGTEYEKVVVGTVSDMWGLLAMYHSNKHSTHVALPSQAV